MSNYKNPRKEVDMRNILYRVWLGDTMRELRSIFFKEGVAQYALLEVKPGENYEYVQLADVPIMQYIGMEDSFGQDIFEGDILSIDFGDEAELCVVKYYGEEGYPAFDTEVSFASVDNVLSMVNALGLPCRVVGNVHEHPELAKAIEVRP